MLGVQREWTTDGSAAVAKHEQIAYIEDAWNKFFAERFKLSKYCPRRPADDITFVDSHGELLEVSEDEADRVIKRGYRELVGTLLWPARNCYPRITYAVTQLCRRMDRSVQNFDCSLGKNCAKTHFTDSLYSHKIHIQ
eukprot:COSAG05_NODE_2891_length_2535_cov_3.156814_1_plen_137_part_10